jgi:hypothetical protein
MGASAILVAATGVCFALQDTQKSNNSPTSAPPPTINLPVASKARETVKPPPVDTKPYKIRAWVTIAPGTPIDERARTGLIHQWKELIKRFVGAPWQLEVADGLGPLVAGPLESLSSPQVVGMTKDFDKAWLIEIRPMPASHGVLLSGREFDQATGLLSLVFTEPARVLDDAPRALLKLSLEMFSPTAEIGLQSAGGVSIRVQGSSLPAANAVGRVVKPGSVFRIARVHYNPDGSIQQVNQIARTYLQVESFKGADAFCQIVSRLRDPLTRLVRGRYKVFAVGVKPTSLPTRIRFVTGPPENRPAAGYTLQARPVPTGPPRTVGTTDRDGRVVLEPRFAQGLTMLKLLAAGLEPLDEMPIMPGERVDELTITLPSTKPDTVALESRLLALRDTILDQVTSRARIETLIKPRAEAENWDEVRVLLNEYSKMPKRTVFQEQLKEIEDAARKKQLDSAQPVITRTALNLLRDVGSLVERYLDDGLFAGYEEAYDQYAATAPPEKARAKTLSNERPEAALSRLNVASAANAGQDESNQGLLEYKPEGAGFRVAFPKDGAPAESTKELSLSSGNKVVQHIVMVDDSKLGRFTVTYFDYEKAPTRDSQIQRSLDSAQAMFLTEGRRSRVINERPITLAGYPGREVEVEIPAVQEGGLRTLSRSRAFVVGGRFFTVSILGTEAMVRARLAEIFLDSFRPIGSAATGAARPDISNPLPKSGEAGKKSEGEKETPKQN